MRGAGAPRRAEPLRDSEILQFGVSYLALRIEVASGDRLRGRGGIVLSFVQVVTMSDAETVLVVSSAQKFVSCPNCRAGISLAGVESLDGAKLLCPRCGARFVLSVGNKPRQT